MKTFPIALSEQGKALIKFTKYTEKDVIEWIMTKMFKDGVFKIGGSYVIPFLEAKFKEEKENDNTK